MKRFCFPLILLLLLAGCAHKEDMPYRADAVSFGEGDLYAAAYVGYLEPEELSLYVGKYLDEDISLPVHYVSPGDWYLIIPRYSDMSLKLYRNDMETMEKELFFESARSVPFLVQCNVSDIFADLTISITYGDETAEFSPFISLKDGSVQFGEKGVNLTERESPSEES